MGLLLAIGGEPIEKLAHVLITARAQSEVTHIERHEKIKKADIISPITPQKLELLGLSRLYTTYNTIESLPGSEFMQGTYQLGTYGTSWSWTSGQLQGATSGTYIL